MDVPSPFQRAEVPDPVLQHPGRGVVLGVHGERRTEGVRYVVEVASKGRVACFGLQHVFSQFVFSELMSPLAVGWDGRRRSAVPTVAEGGGEKAYPFPILYQAP